MRSKLTDFSSIPAVIKDLTLEEKAQLVAAYTACHSYEIPDMDISSIVMTDGATGVNGGQVAMDYFFSPEVDEKAAGYFFMNPDLIGAAGMDLPALRVKYRDNPNAMKLISHVSKTRPGDRSYISFPSGINIGAAFDPESAGETGRAVGWELRDAGIDICLGPNVDIMRDPLGGRNYEMYGEDPTLVSETGVGFIKGMQSTGTGGCAKHYIANNQETNRNSVNEYISTRALRELYSRGFMAAVKEGKVASIMSAYDSVNGKFSSYNKMLLTDWLREEWGFEGLVVSDWGAVSDHRPEALEAGMEMILCGPNDMTEVVEAVKAGTFSEETLNKRVARVLETILKVREAHQTIPAEYDAEALKKAAYKAVVNGAVLLKNEGNVLPLQKGSKITFYGRHSKELMECGTGSTAVPTLFHTNPYESSLKFAPNALYETMDGADTLIYTVTAPAGENVDREEMNIEGEDQERLPKVLKEAKEKGLKTVVLLNISGPIDVRSWIDYADSVLSIFIPGCMGGEAAAGMLFGEEEPAGRLPVSFPVRYEDTPAYPNFPGEHLEAFYGEGIFVGYRSYDKRGLPVQYPFGFGLSYTSFDVKPAASFLTWDVREIDSAKVPVQVKNTGSRAGHAVVQVYASENKPHVLRPVKELVGFAKVLLAPGEEKIIEVPIKQQAMEYFDVKLDRWVLSPGRYTLSIGISADEIVGQVSLELKGEKVYVLGPESTVGEVWHNPEAKALVNQYAGGMFDMIDEDNIKMMSHQKIGGFLAQRMIALIPDTVRLDGILKELYVKLAQLDI